MSFISYYSQPLMLKICLFGFSSGLTLMLSGNTLNFWLTKLGLSNVTIGLFSLAALPYAFKFIWAPFVDLIKIPLLTKLYGQRLSWIVTSQFFIIISLLILAKSDPTTNMLQTAILGFIIAFMSISQDISLDALRVNNINNQDKGMASSMYILGYRLGMLCSGGGAIYLSSFLSWQYVYFIIASLVFINSIVIFFNCKNMEQNFNLKIMSIGTIFTRFKDSFRNIKNIIIVLIFIILYKLSDNIILTMSNPFLMYLGFKEREIVKAVKIFGLFANILGTFIGGYFLRNMSIYKALLVFGIIHSLTNLLFILQTHVGHDLHFLYFTVGIENFTGGMAMSAYITFIASLCYGKFAGTQYSIYSSMMGVSRVIIPSVSGFLVEKFDWTYFFLISALIAAIPLSIISLIKNKS